jgi:hypothetical protein
MHRSPVAALGLALVAACLAARLHAAPAEALVAELGPHGLTSLTWAGTNLLADGDLRVLAAFLQRPDGTVYTAAESAGARATGAGTRRLLAQPWGQVTADYAVAADRVDIDITVEVNPDADTLVALRLQLAELQFAAAPRLENRSFLFYTKSDFVHNLGGPGVLLATFGDAAVALCSRDLVRPLAFGLAPAADAGKTAHPLLAFTGRHPAARERFPWIERPVHPGGRDTWRVSLRFGDAAAAETLTADLYAAYAKAYPYALEWPDRRPIARLFLSSSPREGFPPPTNPRGWLNDARIDTSTEEGRAAFRTRLMDWAAGSVRIMKEMDAQGMITWDIEGQEQPHMISYLGDPRSLPPEMEALADEYFQLFRDAGFRTGICIRPQRPVRAAYSEKVEQIGFSDHASRVANLAAKIEAARKRWGCTLFYLDSNVDWSGDPVPLPDAAGYSATIDDDALAALRRQFPDVLIMPEWETLRSYAYGAPYSQLNYNRNTAPPAPVLQAYPQAFLVNSPDDASVPAAWPELLAAVRRGDILYFSGWWASGENAMVRALYRLAAADAPLRIERFPAEAHVKGCALEERAVTLELVPRDPKAAPPVAAATLRLAVAGSELAPAPAEPAAAAETPAATVTIAPATPPAAGTPAGFRAYDVTLPVGRPVRLEWK